MVGACTDAGSGRPRRSESSAARSPRSSAAPAPLSHRRICRRHIPESQAIFCIAMANVTVYTTDQCARCVTAKTLLTKRGIGYEEINLAKDPDGRAELAKRTGMITFPQIVIDGETLGGLDELVAADRQGRLKSLLAA